MKILFAGSPEIAVPTLERIARDFEIVGVLTNPDSQQGRGKKLKATPVKQKALDLGLRVLEYDHLYADARKAVRELDPDILVSFAFGRIFGPKFLNLFSLGGVNVHPSVLPEYRGSAPIQAAILNGDRRTGITIQKIALEMDTGDILKQTEFELSGTETTESLTRKVSDLAPELVAEVLHEAAQGRMHAESQDDSLATYCSHIHKDDAIIDWDESAQQISSKIRAYYPWPKAETGYAQKRLMITYALAETESVPFEIAENTEPGTVLAAVKKRGVYIQTGKGLLRVERLQLQSKKEMDASSFLNGNPDFIGTVLG
jgi:methionyl-tRNA formyltransferase